MPICEECYGDFLLREFCANCELCVECCECPEEGDNPGNPGDEVDEVSEEILRSRHPARYE